ncbi:interferon-induced protein 44-like isoform X2 [Mercenaria mercenaria]|uniref:interferon-induced protein 44-like isoform X2 n=1 Tax=Mercenaria mercenaria TaxID=6596 RepID=UPI00234E96AA|nr:interferon-induced protein 44-like isoform X2 [Mercenaria mercenaria]XP_053383600.1 interferon-induced protein 44-like isoform X2 [Mercenaria mercenaria]
MEGKLSEKGMDQLEKWIGTGPKIFTLRYAITRDGCDATVFHQKCDNQGPTVTVLYNQHGSVYGGYTSVSWRSANGIYVRDDKAFLYQLRYNGSDRQNIFHVKIPGQAVTHNSSYAPVFYDDLLTFNAKINKFGSVFPLNGSMSTFGTTYNNNGVSNDQVNNGSMDVTELEVYSVADGQRRKTLQEGNTPWRKTKDWNEKFLDELKEEIVTFKPVQDLQISEARILMLGPVGAGKSSFYNTIDSIYRGRITQRACSGSAEQSLSTAYIPYMVKVRSGSSLNFRLCDTRGLEESMGIDVLECNYLLDGNVPAYYEFNPTSPISPKSPGFKSDPSTNDIVHCAVFVLDSTTLEVLSSKVVEKMKGLRELMNQKRIPQIILLTKIDKLCKEVEKNVSFVYHSPTVKQAVEKASQILGLPRANILPVKNYENEAELDDNVDILALLALRKMLHFTEDFMHNLIDKRNDVQVEMKKMKLEN